MDKADLKAVDLQQLFLAMTEEVRIIVVKLADRLHNMRTLGSMRPEKQQKIANETLQVGMYVADGQQHGTQTARISGLVIHQGACLLHSTLMLGSTVNGVPLAGLMGLCSSLPGAVQHQASPWLLT